MRDSVRRPLSSADLMARKESSTLGGMRMTSAPASTARTVASSFLKLADTPRMVIASVNTTPS